MRTPSRPVLAPPRNARADDAVAQLNRRPADAHAEKATPSLYTFRRVVMSAATALLSINLWTGSPLLSLWLGSRVAEGKTPSFTPILVVIASLAVMTLAIWIALAWLEERYRSVVGLPPRESRMTWLRAFNAQREPVRHVPTSAPERVVMVVVYVAVIAFVTWWLFFAGAGFSASGPY